MKQVIVVNTSLNMPVGKLAAQVAHASQFAMERAGFWKRLRWRVRAASTKVVLRGGDELQLKGMLLLCRYFGLPHFLVRDAGRTVLEPGTITALGIGPADIATIDRVTGGLKLL